MTDHWCDRCHMNHVWRHSDTPTPAPPFNPYTDHDDEDDEPDSYREGEAN